jgi:N utilization substance protein B
MSTRRRAREVALQALYQLEANPDQQHLDRFLIGRLRFPPLVAFARDLVDGVQAERAALDAELESRALRWRVSRMAATDRASLRIAVCELRHTDVPGPVAVNEAIDLARRYGSEESPRFVAGLLGRILGDRDGTPADTHVTNP